MSLYFDLDTLTVIELRGRDRLKLLNNLCTQNLNGLRIGSSAEAFLTDVKGRTLGHVQIAAFEEVLSLFGVAGQATRLIEHIDRYIIREDVQLADRSGELHWLGLTDASKLCREAGLQPPAADPPFSWHLLVTVSDSGMHPAADPTAGILLQSGWFGSGSCLIGIPTASRGILETWLSRSGWQRGDENAMHYHRIRSGWPLWGVDFDDRNLPQEIGRDAMAISFTKGCYLGQETVARLDALGQVQKKLFAIAIDPATSITTDRTIFCNDQEAGKITSVATFEERTVAFAWIKRAFFRSLSQATIGGSSISPLA